jgi:hypothetical protein
MKILAIHSEGNPEQGPWSKLQWDCIVDLGRGGAGTYERWSNRFGCPAGPLDALGNGFDDSYRVRELLGRGCGRLTDEYGLDWWEIMSILLTSEIETLILLQRLVQSLSSNDEVHVSRPGFHADALRFLLGRRVQVFPSGRNAARRGPARYLHLSARLSRKQIIDIIWDKYDPGYQLRGRLVRKHGFSARPVVLLPTAYVNVSRTGMEYANSFPDEHFLLVTTRRSGWVQNPPPNVATAWLSSYASVRDRTRENQKILSQWDWLKCELMVVPEFELLDRLGQFSGFPQKFRHGLEVRDAWRNVLDREPVQAVLCADDSNPYTRIPLLLARARGLPNVASHHGALDGRYLYKRSHADIIWAKGNMERDYLVRVCGLPREKVELGAPALASSWSARGDSSDRASRPNIVFFSELYEVAGGRTGEFYRDVLPSLADLALASNHELVVKLHPAESERERTRMLGRVLSVDQLRVTRVVSGPLKEDLLAKTWFGVTVISTVAMECAIRGIPCFLCKWLEFSHHGYVEQFIRFGVGIGMESPREIGKIPQYLREHPLPTNLREECLQPVAPSRLRELVTSFQKPCTAAAS